VTAPLDFDEEFTFGTTRALTSEALGFPPDPDPRFPHEPTYVTAIADGVVTVERRASSAPAWRRRRQAYYLTVALGWPP